MRLIGTISDASQAELLGAWFLAEGIDAHFERAGEQIEVWARNEDQVNLASGELARFISNPADARFGQAVTRAQEVQRQKIERNRTYQKNVRHQKMSGGRGIPQRGPLTMVVLMIAVAVAMLTNFGNTPEWSQPTMFGMSFTGLQGEEAERAIANGPEELSGNQVKLASIRKGEVWRLVTPIFIHFSVAHLAFNFLAMFNLGRLLETRYGSGTVAGLVLLTAVLSNLVQAIVPVEWGGVPAAFIDDVVMLPFGGLSGVIYGLFGYAWVKSVIDPTARIQLSQSAVIMMIGWLFLCMLPISAVHGSGIDSRVANWAHGIGLAVGMMSAYLVTVLGRGRGSVKSE